MFGTSKSLPNSLYLGFPEGLTNSNGSVRAKHSFTKWKQDRACQSH